MSLLVVGSVALDDVSREAANPKDISELIERLGRGEFDMVAIGRMLLSDPQWAAKVRDGRAEEVLAYSKEALLTLA